MILAESDELLHFKVFQREHQVRIIVKKFDISILSSGLGFVGFNHHGNDLVQVADDP